MKKKNLIMRIERENCSQYFAENFSLPLVKYLRGVDIRQKFF
jgi:hypothetical protein